MEFAECPEWRILLCSFAIPFLPILILRFCDLVVHVLVECLEHRVVYEDLARSVGIGKVLKWHQTKYPPILYVYIYLSI